jgi:hypothetical protein
MMGSTKILRMLLSRMASMVPVSIVAKNAQRLNRLPSQAPSVVVMWAFPPSGRKQRGMG